jgi:hypothetical protein
MFSLSTPLISLKNRNRTDTKSNDSVYRAKSSYGTFTNTGDEFSSNLHGWIHKAIVDVLRITPSSNEHTGIKEVDKRFKEKLNAIQQNLHCGGQLPIWNSEAFKKLTNPIEDLIIRNAAGLRKNWNYWNLKDLNFLLNAHARFQTALQQKDALELAYCLHDKTLNPVNRPDLKPIAELLKQ